MKLLASAYILICLGIFANAQTAAQLNAQIARNNAILLEYQKCFHDNFSNPNPHKETYTLSSGKVVSALAQSDYGRSQFTSVDEFIEDVKLWSDSPYLWELKHKKSSKALSDDRDLSKWEIDSFSQISQEYFSEGGETFHIAAHGLVDERNAATNQIRIGGQDLNAQETAEFILKSMHDVFHNILNAGSKPFTIVIHSCHSAEGPNNFTQELSRILGKDIKNLYVVGAPDVVYCNIENGKYNEYIAERGNTYNPNPNKKNWAVYKNGGIVELGRQTYQETIRQIQHTQ